LATDTAAKHRVELVKHYGGDDGDDDEGQELRQIDTGDVERDAGRGFSRSSFYIVR